MNNKYQCNTCQAIIDEEEILEHCLKEKHYSFNKLGTKYGLMFAGLKDEI